MILFRNQVRIDCGWKAICLFVLLCTVVGCNKPTPTAMVKGQVTVKGKQLTQGTVVFYGSENGDGATCPIDSQGNYETKEKLFAGAYTVAIGPAANTPVLEPGAVGMPPPPQVDSTVPSAFTSIQTSGLKTEIVDGENVYDIKIP